MNHPSNKGVGNLFVIALHIALFLPQITAAQQRLNNFQVWEDTYTPKLRSLARQAHQQHIANLRSSRQLAKLRNWYIQKEVNDTVALSLTYIDHRQLPVYYINTNLNAAKAINTDKVKAGGDLGLNLSGKGILIGEWDYGIPMVNHDYLKDRVTAREDAQITSHATHVAGTLVGNTSIKAFEGMAPEATVAAYDWEDAHSEMYEEVENGMLLSNHSYAIAAGWLKVETTHTWQWLGDPNETEDYKFGYYNSTSYNDDWVAYNTPYHLIVRGAGNDRVDVGPQPGETYLDLFMREVSTPREPDGGADGYDCIPPSGVGKNILTVGATNDLNKGYNGPQDVQITNFSGWGPTDDGRIKPDVVANGNGITSAYYIESNPEITNFTASLSGTSFAAPSITGSLALLQEWYDRLTGDYLLAATLKGLVIHTAREAGQHEGPDYRHGWGLVDIAAASQLLQDESQTEKAQILTISLSNQDTLDFEISVDGTVPLTATLAWLDPPADPLRSNELNNRSKKLINDLDLRIISLDDRQTYLPYKLDPATPDAPATKGDNELDNIEKIYVSNLPGGKYLVSVTHKGNLQEGDQDFSLILSGLGTYEVRISEAEKAELEKIYQNTGGDNWINSWDLAQPVTTWSGVTIDENGHVTELDLAQNNLTGTFPDVNLPHLSVLNIAQNKISKVEALNQLPALQTLYLQQNRLGFSDILPNNNLATDFVYAPQDSVGEVTSVNGVVGQPVTLTSTYDNTAAGSVYIWYKETDLLQGVQGNEVQIDSVSKNDAGKYYYSITHPLAPDLTLIGRAITLLVSVPDCRLSVSHTLQEPTCNEANGSINLNISNQDVSYTINWNTGEESSSLENLDAGSYSVAINDALGCSFQDTFILNDIASPQVALTQKSAAACGQADGSITIDIQQGIPPYNILWGNGQTTRTANNLAAGSHQVRVTDANNCEVVQNFIVDNLDGPRIASLQTQDAVCEQSNGSIQLTVEAGTPPYEITWDHGANTPVLADLAPGGYVVNINDANGCEIIDSVEIGNIPSPDIQLLSQQRPTCGQSNGSLEVDITKGSAPYTISWDNGQQGLSAQNLFPGSYKVTVIDNNQCTTEETFTLEGLDSIHIEMTAISHAVCGEQNGSANIDISGGIAPYKIRWSTGQSGNSISNVPAGNYLVVAADSSGCIDSLMFEIENEGAPQASFEVEQTGLSLSFINTSQNAELYRWDFGNGEWSSASNPETTYDSVGVYEVRLIAVHSSCGSDTLIQRINVGTLTHTANPYGEADTYFSLYPNPVEDNLYIRTTLTGDMRIAIIDLAGKMLKPYNQTYYISSNIPLNLPVAYLPTGVYILHISTQEASTYRKFYKK